MAHNHIKRVQFAHDVQFISTFADEEYGNVKYNISSRHDH